MTTAEVRAQDSFCGVGTTAIRCRPAYRRRMSWLMPRLLRVAPYIGYVLLSGRKPGAPTEAP